MSQGTQQMTMTHEQARELARKALAMREAGYSVTDGAKALAEYVLSIPTAQTAPEPAKMPEMIAQIKKQHMRAVETIEREGDQGWALPHVIHEQRGILLRAYEALLAAQTARVPTREEIAGIVYRVALRVLGTASAGTLRTLGHEIADALLHTPDTDATTKKTHDPDKTPAPSIVGRTFVY